MNKKNKGLIFYVIMIKKKWTKIKIKKDKKCLKLMNKELKNTNKQTNYC